MMITRDPQKIERGKPSKPPRLQKQLAEDSKLWARVPHPNLALGVGGGRVVGFVP